MHDFVNIYCPECDAEVHVHLHTQQAVLSVRGEDVDYDETVAPCPICGTIIGDAKIESVNLERAYAVYRSRHGILSPDEMRNLRVSYGLSLREFSKFLGFGEQTAYRYERGDLPDQAHSNTIRSATTISGARLLLSQNKSKLSKRSTSRIEQHIQNMEANEREAPKPRFTLEEREANAPSAANGYRRLNLERAFALVYILATKCRNLYWTKLQKAAFFADMAFFEKNSQSLTGLTYAHATYGPVIDRKEEMRFILAEKGIVDFREQGFGEILVPLNYDNVPFTQEELSFIDMTAEFVNTFDNATDLSEYSHSLSCWANSTDGATIEYTHHHDEIVQAMDDRMRHASGIA